MLLKPTKQTRVGVNYRSDVNHTLSGRFKVTGTAGSNFDIAGTAKLSTPDILNLAIAQDLTDKWTVMAQANWYGWSNFDAITVRNAAGGIASNTIQDYQDTWGFALGAEYKYSDMWTFRGGFQHDQTPTTDQYRTTRIPDGDRNWYALGATYHKDQKWSFDVGLAYVDVSKESINLSRNSGTASVKAESSGNVTIASFGVNYKF